MTSPSSKASAEGIICDSNGFWIAGFTRNLGSYSWPIAECWALRDGLQLAKDLNIPFLEVELDSMLIVSLLELCDCRELLTTFQQVCFYHNYREANKCIATLAKWGGGNNVHTTF